MSKIKGILVISIIIIGHIIIFGVLSFQLFLPIAISFGRHGFGMVESVLLTVPIIGSSILALGPLLTFWFMLVRETIESIMRSEDH